MSFEWRRRRGALVVLLLAAALFVAAAATVDAVRQRSWEPVASVGWLPAVLLAGLHPATRGRCGSRLRGRARG